MTAVAHSEEARSVILIDLSSLYWSAWHSSAESELSAARSRTLEAVLRVANVQPGSLIAICCDSGRSFRKDLMPEYKAQRPEKDHSALSELDKTKEKLRADGYLLWEASGFEADDVIATACGQAVMAGHEVLIASADKDLLQLLAYTKVRALRTHNWAVVGPDDVVTKFGCHPDELGDWLALVGDSSDNIKGAPGVGPKTATALITAHGSLANIWAALEREPAKVSTPAIVRSLQQNKDVVELARKLVELRRDVPIDFSQLYEERKPTAMSQEDENMDEPDANYVDPISRGPGSAATAPAPETKIEEKTPPPEQAPPANGNGHKELSTVIETAPLVGVPVAYERALEPTSLGVAFKLGQALYDSRLYTRFPTPQAITAVIIRGREMSVGALTSLDCFFVVEGRPYPYAYFIISRAKEHSDCDYFQLVETTATLATWETKNKRNPKPTRFTYTIEQARLAGLLVKEKSNWNTRPEDMLIKTSGAKLARVEYPSAALGLVSIEEMGLE